MGAALALEGMRFHRLTVLSFAGSRQSGRTFNRYWLCRCDCGKEVTVRATYLANGAVKSCGCLKADRSREWSKTLHRLNVKTGYSRHSTYSIWRSMKRRCADSSGESYHLYGGRGITVCERWKKFANFLADMGLRPDGRSLDRIDGNKGYEPGNCRWATSTEQQNNMRSNVVLTYQGRSHTMAQWARILGLHKATIQYRINAGWPVDKVLTMKPDRSRPRAEYPHS